MAHNEACAHAAALMLHSCRGRSPAQITDHHNIPGHIQLGELARAHVDACMCMLCASVSVYVCVSASARAHV